MARRVTVALLVAGMLGTIPSPAAGDALYRVEGRWHTRTVRYFASPEYAADARVGAAAWNASGARIRWVASSRAQARVVIRMDTAAAPPGRTVSNGRRATIRLAPRAALGARAAGLPAWVERFHVQRAIVRELGRVLGLGAEGRRCAAMAPPAGPDACVYRPAEEPWLYRCRLLEPDDAAGAVRLYGGRARAAAPEFCPLEAPPPPVTGLALTPDDAQRPSAATIAWTTPDDPAAASVRITGRLGTCPTGPLDPDAYRVAELPAVAGARQAVVDGAREVGHHCYAVWVLGRYGTPAQPAIAEIDWPELPEMRPGAPE